MKRSKVIFGVLAAMAGLLIGLANPKEAKAATQDLSSGTYNVSTLDGNTQYEINGDVTFIIDQDKTLALSSDARIVMSAGDKLTIRKGEGNHKLTIGTTSTNTPLFTSGRNELTIESGNVEIKNDNAGSVFGGGTFNMRGGTLKTGARGISAGTINISGGTVEAALGCGSWSSPTVNITGGTVKAVGGDYGIGEEIRSGRMYGQMTLNISGGNVYAEATGANHEYSDGRRFLVSGISVGSLNITGGNLEAKVSHDDQVAIMSLNNITIDDVSIQTPEGGSRESYSITLGSYTFNGYTIKKDGAGAKHVVIGDGSPVTYKVEVSAENGTAKAEPSSDIVEGTTVKLTAASAEGYEFDKWTTETEGVTIVNPASATGASFNMPARDVTVTANFKALPEGSVSVGVTADEGGKASADKTSAKKDEKVNIKAEADEGYEFTEWTVVKGSVSLEDPKKAETSFTVNDIKENIELKAGFKKVAEDEVSVGVTADEGGKASADKTSAKKDEKVNIKAEADEGYEFTEWTVVKGSVNLEDLKKAETSFTVNDIKENIELKAGFKKNSEPGPEPEPGQRDEFDIREDLTIDEEFGMKYNISEKGGDNLNNVKISRFEVNGDVPEGIKVVQSTDRHGDCFVIKGKPEKTGKYKFSVTIDYTADGHESGSGCVINFTLKVKDKDSDKDSHHDDDDDDDDNHGLLINPDAITAFYIVNGAPDLKAMFGKQEQGPLCKAAFTANVPQGFKEAFSFSMSYGGANTDTLKNGTLQLYIPGQYQKTGRTYAVMAMDKYGQIHIYQDTDALPFVFTSPLNFEGYAFNLIYKD